MPNFFGNPVLPTYTGIDAEDAFKNTQEAQQQNFNQQRQHAIDVQDGRDSGDDEPGSPIGGIVRNVRSLFGGGGSAAQSPVSAPATGTDTAPSAGSSGLMRTYASDAAPGAPAASGATDDGSSPDLWGMNRQDATDATGMLTPAPAAGAGTPAPKMGAGAGGAPMAGEFVPQLGRFATTQDGQQYTQMAQAAAAGIPPQGLMATRSGQPQGTVTRTPGTPSAPIQPQPGAAAPPAATRAPAPAPTLPAGSAPATAAPQLVNAQAQAMQPGAPPQPPSIPQFMASNGVAPEVSRPGLGTVNRAVPLLPNAYDALAKANLEGYTQGQETNRTVLSEAGAGARAEGEEATQRDIAQSGQANQRDIAALDRTTQTNIALLNAKVRERELDAEVQKMGIMFGFQQNAQVQKGMDDIVKGAQASEDAVTHTTDAMKVLQLAAKDPSLGSAAKLRAYMAENGLDSQRMSAQIEEISDRELNPSVKGRLQGFLSGATDGVPPADQIAAGVAALGQVRAAAYQTYDQRLRAGALQHTEIPDALQRISVRESTLAPDLFRQGVGSGGGGGTGPMQPPRGAGTGGLAGGNSDQGSLRPVTQGQWKQLQQKFPQQDLTKYYRVVGQ